MNDDTKSIEAPVAVEAPSAMSQEEISRLTDDIVAALGYAAPPPEPGAAYTDIQTVGAGMWA